jgi:hypothetical protein
MLVPVWTDGARQLPVSLCGLVWKLLVMVGSRGSEMLAEDPVGIVGGGAIAGEPGSGGGIPGGGGGAATTGMVGNIGALGLAGTAGLP